MNLFRQDQRFFINFFHMGAILCFFPAILISSTCTDKNNPCFRWTNRHSQFGTFPSKFHQNFLELPFPQWSSKWVFVQISFKRNHWIFNAWPWLWATCVVEDVFMCLDTLTSEFWPIWKLPPSLPECRLIRRQLLVHHSQEKAVLPFLLQSCETETSHVQPRLRRLQSRLLQCHLGVRLDLYTSEIVVLTVPFFEMTDVTTDVHQCSKMDFLVVSSCVQNYLLFALYFVQLPGWNRLRHRNELVHQIVTCHRVISFACEMIFIGCQLVPKLMRFLLGSADNSFHPPIRFRAANCCGIMIPLQIFASTSELHRSVCEHFRVLQREAWVVAKPSFVSPAPLSLTGWYEKTSWVEIGLLQWYAHCATVKKKGICEGRQDWSSNPYRIEQPPCSSSWMRQRRLFPRHVHKNILENVVPLDNTTLAYDFADIDVVLHDDLERSAVEPAGQWDWLEQRFHATETFSANGDDVFVWEHVGFFHQHIRHARQSLLRARL